MTTTSSSKYKFLSGGLARLAIGMFAVAAVAFTGAPALADGPAADVVTTFPEPAGVQPMAPPILASDGNLYGTALTTIIGGGCVYKVTPDGRVTPLHVFASSAEGAYPSSTLVEYAGNNSFNGTLYGTTRLGGKYNHGTIFRITKTGHLTTLYSFSGTSGDGADPYSGLTLAADGSFYGTTFQGGAKNEGTVFRMTPQGSVAILHSFDFHVDGAWSYAPVTRDASGNLLTTTHDGGRHGMGTVVELSSAGNLRWAYHFGDQAGDGAFPQSGLTPDGAGGYLGSTYSGGTGRLGTIYRVTSKGKLTTLHGFTDGTTEATSPSGPLVDGGNGKFYGIAESAEIPGQQLVVFDITPDGTYEKLVAITAYDGGDGQYGVTLGSDGNLYANAQGGDAKPGEIFRVTTAGQLAAKFELPSPFGGRPVGALIPAGLQQLAGVTRIGGLGSGFVYTIDSGTAITRVASVPVAPGQLPTGGLVLSGDGNYYGVEGTSSATRLGDGMSGFIYCVTPSGVTSIAHQFSGADGACPYGELVAGPDGALYGVTRNGGTSSQFTHGGVLYKYSASGGFHILHDFDPSGGGATVPGAGVTPASDGYLYGVTQQGGANGNGAIYRIRPNGSQYAVVYSFPTLTTATRYAPRVVLTDGNIVDAGHGVLYLTYCGRAYSYILSTGAVQTIADPAEQPYGRMVVGTDGDLYAMSLPDVNTAAHILQVAPEGSTTIIYTLPFDSSGRPYIPTTLTEGSDGNLYATAMNATETSSYAFKLETHLPR